MDQSSARILAAHLNAYGHGVVADSLGGPAGSERARTWGVRAADSQYLYDDPHDLPFTWQRSADAPLYHAGQAVAYRPSLSQPCVPVAALVVGPDPAAPGALVIDVGPSGYEAPHDRTRHSVLPRHLTIT